MPRNFFPALLAVTGFILGSSSAFAQSAGAPVALEIGDYATQSRDAVRSDEASERGLSRLLTPRFEAMSATQSRRTARVAGPSIGSVGLGAVGGLTEFEIGPSLRYWANDRFGFQAHLGFGGDNDFLGDSVDYMRFEPTFIVAIGDFGNASVNVRPYAGGGLRLLRTDIGSRYDNTMLRPAGVGGVEFGFRQVPNLKASGELSISGENDIDDFNLGNGPSIGGVRLSALVHWFFD